jgi:RNA polymerase sigma-70 factor (ECF subfamily)
MSEALRDLWERASDGDQAAFVFFYRRHSSRVFSHCWMRLRSREDASDLTAEVFAVCWERRDRVSYSSTDDVLPWLLATANNLMRNHHRALDRARRRLEAVAADPPPPDAMSVAIEDAADRAAVDRVLSALQTLHRRDREVIELCVLHGMSSASAARVLRVPMATVRARLRRALPRAREAYDRADDGGRLSIEEVSP